MTGPSDKERIARGKDLSGEEPDRERPPRQDLPDPGDVVREVSFISPKGNVYRVIITDERDASDEPKPSSGKRKLTRRST